MVYKSHGGGSGPMRKADGYPQFLQDGATIAVIGGGPAGAFSALHLLAQARQRGRHIRVVIFERSCQPGKGISNNLSGPYAGCPLCAGGVSPRLYEALDALGIVLQPEVIQASIASITVQGNWKSIILPVRSALASSSGVSLSSGRGKKSFLASTASLMLRLTVAAL